MAQVTKMSIEVDVNPTESEEKVKKAVWNLFGDVPTELKPASKGSILTAEAKGIEPLGTFRNVLSRDKIRDASRKALFHGLRGDTFTFYLNKQVAYAGHVSFCEADAESPLGPIKVTVQSSDPQQLVDWLAPRTTRSRSGTA
ncbi:MAG: RNA-binding domain-containing protein [Candidatus Bathyarchaeia archaeon]|jgi:predicted RNA binding protein with dsRBD fold (UPF0201 family)